MATTYTAGLTTSRDKVRFVTGDNKSGRMIVQDEDIDALLLTLSVGKTAVVVAQTLMAHYAEQVNTDNGRISIGAQARMEQYRKLAADLEKRGDDPLKGHSFVVALPKVGGLSHSEKDVDNENEDNIQPQFQRSRNDYPGISNALDPKYEG